MSTRAAPAPPTPEEVIAGLNDKYLRIAYSSVDNRDLRALFGTIFQAADELFGA